MPLLIDEGFSVERLTELGARATNVKAALDHYTNALLRGGTRMDEAGVLRIDLDQLRAAPRAIAERALSICLQSIHKGDYAPERASLLLLLEALCVDKHPASRTLNGCIVSKNASYAIILREKAAIMDAPVINFGETVVWDGRWKVTSAYTALYTIRPLGNPPHDVLDRLAPGLRKAVPKGRARAVLPALWRKEELALIPSLGTPKDAFAQLLTVWPPSSI
jgi:hypothetical protein